MKVSAEIDARHDSVVNIISNNIMFQRGLIAHEKWEDMKIVRSATEEITIGEEHWRSDEWRGKGRVAEVN